MSSNPDVTLTLDGYLAIERAAEDRAEFAFGQRFVLQGASENHNIITVNVLAAIHSQLRRTPCQVYSLDMKVYAARAGKVMYPDVFIVCGEKQFYDDRRDVVLNPLLIIEVLSPSTELYDRSGKFEAYQTIAPFQEYVLISQTARKFERFTRQSFPRWVYHPFDAAETSLRFDQVSCEITLDEIYDRTGI